MSFQGTPLQASDAADADLKNAQLAILISLRPRGQSERCNAGRQDGTCFEEMSPGNYLGGAERSV
jgi:hypothetical protein